MNVLLVGNFLSHSGGRRSVCEDLAEHLAGAGWPVLTASARPGRLARLADMMITAWRCRYLYSLAHIDVYSGTAFAWAEAVSWVLRQAGKPYVLTLHGGDLPGFAQRWPGRVGRLLGSAAIVTVPSGYLLHEMQRYRTDLRLIPNPLDIERYEFRLRRRPSPSLVWLRAFHAIYNPALMVHVVAVLQVRHHDIHVTMIGPDKGDGSLQETQRMAERLGIAGRVTIVPGVPKSKVPTWLRLADIFVNTTHVDNAPVSVLEAMASGLCVVSTNVGGIPYLLEHERDALLVPDDDAVAMAAALSRILTDAGLAERLSGNARHKAEQVGWNSILLQWTQLFSEVVAYA